MTSRIAVVSGPICGGKTSVTDQLVRRHPDAVWLSVSATTRAPRFRSDGSIEEDGVDYQFLSIAAFESAIKKGEMLEYTNPSEGVYYGTPRAPLEQVLRTTNKLILFSVDYVGVERLTEIYPNRRAIWVTAEYSILANRLKARAGISRAEIDRRLLLIQGELSWYNATKPKMDRVWNDAALEATVREVEVLLGLPHPVLV